MATYNTGNALGSTDPRDLYDNSQVFDELVNNTTDPTVQDRFGNARITLANQLGYNFKGDYAAGIELVSYTDIIRYNSEFYRPSASATLPYTTTATLPDADSNLAPVGDANLRQELALNSAGNGSDLIAHTGTSDTVTQALDKRTVFVGSVAELEGSSLSAGVNVYLAEEVRFGEGVVRSGTAPADTLKGRYIVLANGNYWERNESTPVKPRWYGGLANGSDQAAVIDEINLATNTVDLEGSDYTYTGTFSPSAKFINGRIVATNRTFNFGIRTQESPAVTLQSRARIDYGTANSVFAWVPESLVMAGFRFFGSFKKADGRAIATAVDGKVQINDSTDLSIIDTRKTDNWYAVFAGCNESDTAATFVNLPFFRVSSVATNTITLGDGTEGAGESPAATTYDMINDVMAGSEVLVIQEGGIWSGRTTAVTANTNGTITVDDATGLAAGDFFLVAPPEFDEYVYLGSWYLDATEPRNRADTGYKVAALMGQIPTIPASGAVTNTKVPVRAVVSPLACSYLGRLVFSLSTASTGSVNHVFRHDSSSHNIAQEFYVKSGTDSETFATAPIELPFSKEQAFWLEAGGTLGASISGRQFQCYGWVEP